MGCVKSHIFFFSFGVFFSETFVSNSFWAAWEDRHERDNREDFKIPRTVEKSRITHRSEKLRQSVRSVWEYFSLLIFLFLSFSPLQRFVDETLSTRTAPTTRCLRVWWFECMFWINLTNFFLWKRFFLLRHFFFGSMEAKVRFKW